jgi:L-amino acid N-acyltransferase YncA
VRDLSIRLATTADATAVHAIYAPIVRSTAISFELEPPAVEEMHGRIEKTLHFWPWLVGERQGAVLGYAYASRHRERAAYQWSVDVSVYIAADQRGQGIGRALYTALFAILRAQGYRNVCAGIALPNPASVALHEAMSMRPVGIYRHVGYKLGAWHDVGWWQGELQPPPATAEPTAPCALAEVRRRGDWDALLAEPAAPAVAPALPNTAAPVPSGR